MLAEPSLVLYEMQPKDAAENLLRVSDRAGRLRNVDGVGIPQVVSVDLDAEFHSFRTLGDGGCGLHAVFGVPNKEAELECLSGQRAMRDRIERLMLDSPLALQRKVGYNNEHLRSIFASLWTELAAPGARNMQNPEARIFWRNLEEHQPELATQVL